MLNWLGIPFYKQCQVRLTGKNSTAPADAFNPSAENLTSKGMLALYPVFVDDTANVNTHSCIIQTITASVLLAYIIFGFPSSDLWGIQPPCINENKWKMDLTHHMSFLGFHIDSCKLTITWPMDKQLQLHQCITEILQLVHHDGHIPCQLLAQVLGLVWNGSIVLPLGLLYHYSCNTPSTIKYWQLSEVNWPFANTKCSGTQQPFALHVA